MAQRRFRFGDAQGSVYREIGESELNAVNSAGDRLIRAYTCMVTAGKASPRYLGSGTIIEIGEDLFVAIPGHLLNAYGTVDELMARWGGDSDERLSAVEVAEAPDADPTRDLAAIHLGNRNRAGPLAQAVSLHQLDLRAADRLNDLMVVTGSPESLFRKDDQEKSMAIEIWAQGVVALPHDRWPQLSPAVGKPAPTPDINLVLHYSYEFNVDANGAARPPINPIGLSGSGVWRIGQTNDGTFSADDPRLVAVVESAELDTGRWLCATHFRHWLRFVCEAFPAARARVEEHFSDFLKS